MPMLKPTAETTKQLSGSLRPKNIVKNNYRGASDERLLVKNNYREAFAL